MAFNIESPQDRIQGGQSPLLKWNRTFHIHCELQEEVVEGRKKKRDKERGRVAEREREREGVRGRERERKRKNKKPGKSCYLPLPLYENMPPFSSSLPPEAD